MEAAFHFKPLAENTYSEKLESPDGEEYILKFTIRQERQAQNMMFGSYGPIRGFPYRDNFQDKSIPKGFKADGCFTLYITLEWKTKSSKFIRVCVYNAPSHHTGDPYRNNPVPVSDFDCPATVSAIDTDVTGIHPLEKRVFVKDVTSSTISFGNIPTRTNDLRVVVHVTPLKECLSPSQQSIQLPTPDRKDPVLEKKLEQLSIDMINLLHTGNLSDVVLTDGFTEIPVHKVVLPARSSVFAKMLEHPMKESREKRITIEDTSIEVLRQLLHFMYSGTVKIKDSKMAKDLYVTADKYDVQDLKGICSDLLKSIDSNNVLDTLLLADLYSDKLLKEAALNFIYKNYSQLKAQKCWSEFMKAHQSLAIEILSFVIDKKN